MIFHKVLHEFYSFDYSAPYLTSFHLTMIDIYAIFLHSMHIPVLNEAISNIQAKNPKKNGPESAILEITVSLVDRPYAAAFTFLAFLDRRRVCFENFFDWQLEASSLDAF